MRQAAIYAHIDMNDTKCAWIGISRVELDSSNETRLFLIIAQQTR